MKFFLALAAIVATPSDALIQSSSRAFVARSNSSLKADPRQPIMAGNWKMNPPTEEAALSLASGLTSLLGDETCPVSEDDEMCTEVVVFPPHPFISKVNEVASEAGITVGAQSVFFEEKGAYTGAVATSMIKSIGVEYVLCGHSERRTVFNDDDEAINRKVQKVLADGMRPILCIGETREEYDMGIKDEVCRIQLSKDLMGVTKEQMAEVVIAYEPVWAIGTGLVCGADDANNVHKYLRKVLTDLYDEDVAEATRIQYGGSVTPDSVDALMAMSDIDGCLVGGASLDAEKFGRIINFVRS
mmetsp:Transcript_36522/g.85364  ORF Transcript_36522/g.85364 Transcript_36522/m.85364 type:complete len:300 (-) Transcript_36522:273-1172(-)|eukprot:CAMPEP_0113301090 /NCGR_PEP_ID=MMETSP0010_2-20120614/2464_1 /TAXON_ID=216773 ORGANISM="Corethron hystrix, Strain 308" /NCGR_SAMPLE_ID=MMETSP0010_2 /ASSEMBLY_ACC=CAM_ASM_000155 /LENGTH=299 /DNA_ID=CAMNT_0000154655 /DNA_START=76 /DNA_END=975 /DNA_ORIENTATION=- /assembly_acc=CAM_ASM_000155